MFRSRIQPHRMITGLERLDASTEEHFQQDQAGNTLIDELNHFLYQHLRLHVLSRGHFEWRRSLDAVECEVREACRLTWSCLVLTIELGRLPASNRFRESHSGEGTPMPFLDT